MYTNLGVISSDFEVVLFTIMQYNDKIYLERYESCMSEFNNKVENKLIMGAFEKDDAIHPPTYQECAICSFAVSRVVGINFGGEVERFMCLPRKKFVDDDDWCSGFDLNKLALSDEAEVEYDRLEALGKLGDPEDLTKEEIDAFLDL